MSWTRSILAVLIGLLLIGAATTMATAKSIDNEPKEKFTVTGISPTYGVEGATSLLTVTGTGFKPGAQVELFRTSMVGQEQFIATTGEAVNRKGTVITCSHENFAYTYPWEDFTLRVTNRDGSMVWLNNTPATYIAYKPLSLTSVTPTTVYWGEGPDYPDGYPNTLRIDGMGILPGAQVALHRLTTVTHDDQFIEATGESVNWKGTYVTCSVAIYRTAYDVQYWDVRVTNPDGTEYWLPNALDAYQPPA